MTLWNRLALVPITMLALAGAARAETITMNGSYTLPAAPELQPYSTFPTPTATWETRDQHVIFRYELPEDIMGAAGETMTMVATAADVNGADFFRMHCFETGTTAMCSKDVNGRACVLRFTNLGIDGAKVDQFLDAKYGISAQTNLRKMASAIARSDAVGVLSLTPLQ